MRLTISPHAWGRYEERVRAYHSRKAFVRLVERALKRGHEIPIRSDLAEFCVMYRRFSFIFVPGETEDHAVLKTVLPRGQRPFTEEPPATDPACGSGSFLLAAFRKLVWGET